MTRIMIMYNVYRLGSAERVNRGVTCRKKGSAGMKTATVLILLPTAIGASCCISVLIFHFSFCLNLMTIIRAFDASQ